MIILWAAVFDVFRPTGSKIHAAAPTSLRLRPFALALFLLHPADKGWWSMHYVRLIKGCLVCAVGLFALLVSFNNVVDYDSNFSFVERVLAMDTTFPDNKLRGRAIHSPLVHHAAYWMIIVLEALTGALCAVGGVRMLGASRSQPEAYEAAKALASWGLFLGILLWFTGFMTVGAEWFLMWQSATWNGQAAAFRFIVILFATLIFLHQTEPKD